VAEFGEPAPETAGEPARTAAPEAAAAETATEELPAQEAAELINGADEDVAAAEADEADESAVDSGPEHLQRSDPEDAAPTVEPEASTSAFGFLSTPSAGAAAADTETPEPCERGADSSEFGVLGVLSALKPASSDEADEDAAPAAATEDQPESMLPSAEPEVAGSAFGFLIGAPADEEPAAAAVEDTVVPVGTDAEPTATELEAPSSAFGFLGVPPADEPAASAFDFVDAPPKAADEAAHGKPAESSFDFIAQSQRDADA